ncbi:unnamed protein product [Cladocopium goreaui]|uniref:RNA helicase n=1 Tax=Cladocopium goreaui TaxID=2562237 RepID=A0A9P1DXA6_9DINO|nr:unnamed protein product [Cladocopium goreaui]
MERTVFFFQDARDAPLRKPEESESCKAKEVMEERLKGKDHQLQSQEVELQRGVRAVEDAKVEGERRWAKSQDEEVDDEELDTGERFRGFIHDRIGDKMFVTCDGVPPEFADRPPKITKKSQAPAGLDVGSWITFNLLDEWPGENWGSLLAVDIEETEPDPDEALSSAVALEAAGFTATGEGMMRPRAKAARKARNGRGAPWPRGKGGDRASLAAAAERLRAVTQNRTAPGKPAATATIRRAPVQTRATPVAAMAGGDTGLTKSGAVAAFRQAREAGRHFDSGWSKTGPGPAPKAWVPKNTLRGKRLSSQDLLPWILGSLDARHVWRVARGCAELRRTATRPQSLLTLAESCKVMESKDPSVRAMLPKEKQEWTLERLHLCQEPPCLAAISFAFASDAITINAHHELERIAGILVKHPGLRLSIVGTARPDAPPELGLALSQARAVRVRSHLLGLLSELSELSSCQWQEEEAMDCGVRAGGYDEGEEIEDALAFYSCQRWVGDRIRAIGRWERHRMRAHLLCYSTGQCATIDVAGFDWGAFIEKRPRYLDTLHFAMPAAVVGSRADQIRKVFLEAPEDLSAEDVQSMEESREAQEISVEMPEQVLDAFPPISSFEDLQGILPDYAYEGLNAMGIEVPMPIQASWPLMALAGLDVVGIAKTGSGKTLAYVLPALAHLEAQAPKPKGQGTPLVQTHFKPGRELQPCSKHDKKEQQFLQQAAKAGKSDDLLSMQNSPTEYFHLLEKFCERNVRGRPSEARLDWSLVALVLAPTRELAVQIADMAKAVTQFSGSGSNHPGGLSSAVLYGGGQGSKAWQVADVRNAGHLVAATPGRLLDVMDSSEVTLERVTLLVLDEADRMLECGFEEQVGRIGKTVRSDRQTLFFSATWPTQVQHMAQLMCSSDLPPVRILAGQRTDGEGPTSREDILQEVVVFEQPTWEERDNAKQELLYAHLREVLSDESHKTLVFVSRKNLADTLANRLKSEGFRANVMHGGKSQDSRLNTLEGFRNGEIQLLVTTDVMGRGLDIPGISHVPTMCIASGAQPVVPMVKGMPGAPSQMLTPKMKALTFYEYDKKWPKLPRKLVDVLEQSGQEVPPELVALAEGCGQDGPVGNIRKPQAEKGFAANLGEGLFALEGLRKKRDAVKSLQEKLDEKVRLEHQLKEKVCILESQVQQHLAEASRLRQDVLRLQTLADERGLTVEKVQKREDNSSEKASEMQKRLQETQSALLTERGKLQETEVELYRARESLSSARKEADEVKRTEEAARREAIRRSDEKLAQELSHTQQLLANRVSRAEEQVAERDAEILRLDRELTQCRGYLAQREREASQLGSPSGYHRVEPQFPYSKQYIGILTIIIDDNYI